MKIDKNLYISFALSLLLHIPLFVSLTIDFSETLYAIQESASYAKDRMKKALSKGKNPSEKIEEALKESSELVKEALENIGKGKFIKKKDQSLSKNSKDHKDKKNLKGGSEDRGFRGFLPPPLLDQKPLEVSLVYAPPKPVEKAKEPNKKTDILKKDDKKNEVVMQYIKNPPKGGNCEGQGQYGGIGLQFAPLDKTGKAIVVEVPPGYPAYAAGIQKGDIIEGDPLRFRGKEGENVDVVYYRNGERRVATINRVKVCFQQEKVSVNPTVNIPNQNQK